VLVSNDGGPVDLVLIVLIVLVLVFLPVQSFSPTEGLQFI